MIWTNWKLTNILFIVLLFIQLQCPIEATASVEDYYSNRENVSRSDLELNNRSEIARQRAQNQKVATGASDLKSPNMLNCNYMAKFLVVASAPAVIEGAQGGTMILVDPHEFQLMFCHAPQYILRVCRSDTDIIHQYVPLSYPSSEGFIQFCFPFGSESFQVFFVVTCEGLVRYMSQIITVTDPGLYRLRSSQNTLVMEVEGDKGCPGEPLDAPYLLCSERGECTPDFFCVCNQSNYVGIACEGDKKCPVIEDRNIRVSTIDYTVRPFWNIYSPEHCCTYVQSGKVPNTQLGVWHSNSFTCIVYGLRVKQSEVLITSKLHQLPPMVEEKGQFVLPAYPKAHPLTPPHPNIHTPPHPNYQPIVSSFKKIEPVIPIFVLGLIIFIYLLTRWLVKNDRAVSDSTRIDVEAHCVPKVVLPNSSNSKTLHTSLGHYTFLEMLGHGAFGIVYLALCPEKGKVAIKTLHCSSNEDLDCALDEFRAWRAMPRHPHIVPLLDMVLLVNSPDQITGDNVKTHSNMLLDKEELLVLPSCHNNEQNMGGTKQDRPENMKDGARREIYLVMPYYPEGTLEKFVIQSLESGEGPLSEYLIRKWIAQLADALSQLHHNGLVHCDVKPCNILMTNNHQSVVLADFGIVHRIGVVPSNPTHSPRGTLAYLSPEQLTNIPQQTQKEVDMWALGCVLFALITRQVRPETVRFLSMDRLTLMQRSPSSGLSESAALRQDSLIEENDN